MFDKAKRKAKLSNANEMFSKFRNNARKTLEFIKKQLGKGHNKKVVCYWGTWANYRPKDGKFTPEDIDPSLCTHLIYSFAGLDSENDTIKPLDPWMDLEEGYGLQGYRKATDLKYAYPHLKVSRNR